MFFKDGENQFTHFEGTVILLKIQFFILSRDAGSKKRNGKENKGEHTGF